MALILTGSGADTVNGTNSSDLILSGSGNDIVNAGDGSDIVYLGNGNDTLLHNVTQNLNDYDLYVGGSGVDTLRLFVTTAQKAAIDATNMVSAFNASASTWLQIFNFGAYNSLLGFNLNILVQGFEKIEFVITDPVVNLAPTALDNGLSFNEDSGVVVLTDLKNIMHVDDDNGPANVHVQSITLASGDAISYSVIGDTLQFDANQYNSLLATNSANSVLNITFVDSGGLTVTKTLTLHVEGINDAPTANVDNFTGIDDSISASVINVGNLLTNDTDPDVGDTKVVALASIDSVSGYAFGNALGLGDPVFVLNAGTSNPNVVAEYSITELGVFNNNGSADADIKIYTDGHIELTKNSAFDYLPVGEHLTISGSYTMQDSDGAMSSSTFSIDVVGLDNNDVLLGTAGSDTLSGGAGNDLIIGGAGVDNLSGGAGDDILNAGGSTGSTLQTLTGGLGADTFVFDLNDGFFKTYVGDFRIEQSDKLEFIGVVDANNDGSKLDDLDAIFGVGVTNTLFLGFITTFTASDGSQLLISGASPVHLSDLSANIIFG